MSFDNRMKEIGFWAAPKPGTAAHDELLDQVREREKNPKQKKLMLERFHRANALRHLQRLNGAGLPQDQMIREYNEEYNHRLFNFSIHSLPSSFNTAEAFTRFIPSMSVFKLLREVDYIVSFEDYLDFVTSDDDGLKELAGVEFMEDDVIYSYNGSHNPENLTFQCAGSLTFGISGISLVKHGSEVNVVMLAGQKTCIEEETESIKRSFATLVPARGKPYIKPNDELTIEAVPLTEGSSLWKTIVMCRIDILRSSIDVRYISQDCGNSFQSMTDDVTVFMDDSGGFSDPKLETSAKKSAKRIAEYQSLFEFIKVCLNLPLYAQRKEEESRVERHPTNYSEIRGKLKYKKLDKYAPISEKVALRNVIVIDPSRVAGASSKTFYSPGIKIETSGYWKKLPLDTLGQDKVGQPIHGRTWVEKRISWVEENSASRPVKTSNVSSAQLQSPGSIYVMRCAAHGKDIFKIGLTTRTADLRSNELTSSTAAPDQFLVVEEWEVGDCELAEKIIHERLEPFRINPRREFFHARYSVIFSVIRDVIAELSPDLGN